MKQHTRRQGGNLHFDFWLAFDRSGSVRLTRTEPATGRSERAMKMSVALPLSLWANATLAASVTVDAPPPIERHFDLSAAADALSETLGVDVDIRVVPPVEDRGSDT